MSDKLNEAREIIQHHVIWSMGAGAVPLPVLDIAAVTMVQLDMLKQLSRLYDIDYNESSGKSLITALAGSTLARIGSSFVKSIPGIGSILGGVSMVILSGASTYAIGQVFSQHFERGGTFFDFDMGWAQRKYDEEFNKGKDVASDLEKKENANGQNKGSVFAKLDELVKLKKDGLLTDEEFQKKKAELLAQL